MSNSEQQPGADIAPGSEHLVTVHDLAVSGGGIARLSGMAVFLDAGLPGETLRCRITERKPRFAKAEALETVTASPDIVPSFCPYGGECGGCAWTNLDYAAQTAWKERQVKETLRRVGKVTFADKGGSGAKYLPLIPSPKTTRYRNKMEFAFGFDAEGVPALGLRQRNSHSIVPVEECALCAAPVAPILAGVREWLRESALEPWQSGAGFLRFLVIRCPEYASGGKRQCLAEIITSPGDAAKTAAVKALGRVLLAENSETGVTGFVHSTRRGNVNIAHGDRVTTALGATTITEDIGGVRLEAPVQSFLQANTGAAALLYEQTRAFAAETGAKTLWDVYCGVGGIALSLAGEDMIVHGVESVAEAVTFARKNAANLPGDIVFVNGDAARVMADPRPRPDLVITDPPRAGMAPELRDAILRLKPKHLVCVSCDAASLARDVAAFSSIYRMEKARAVDMFPNTPHVEIVALLSR